VTPAETERLLSTYACLARTTGNMLAAAQGAQWEKLVDLEKHCADLIERMSTLENDDPLPEAVRSRKAQMIRKVLADDAAIRNITEPWLQQLGSMLGANRQEQQLLRSYGPPRDG
jgi:flagellar protein FliT